MLEMMRTWNALENDNKWSMDGALTTAVMLPLLPLLDCMNLDGTATLTDDAEDLMLTWNRLERLRTIVLSGQVEAYCTRAAETVSDLLGGQTNVERNYYTLPPSPAWLTIAFQPAHDESGEDDTFETVFEMMVTSDGPLSNREVDRLQRLMSTDERVLSMVKASTESPLCTLLHQAAAGPAHDRRLVEWLIQMRALDHQPRHLYESNGEKSGDQCVELAVHSAARAGFVEIVHLLLEAGQLRDLAVSTYRTNESLVDIAAKNCDRALLGVLKGFGACSSGTPVFAVSNASNTTKKKSKKTKKKRPTRAASPQDLAVDSESTNVVDVRPLAASGDAIDQLALDLETLKPPQKGTHRSVLDACATAVVELLEKIRARLEVFDNAKDTTAFPQDVILREVLLASRAIFLLNRYHRQLREIRKFVRHEIWQFDDSDEPELVLERFLRWAGVGHWFETFFSFVMLTCRLLIAIDRKPQVEELLVILERRMLKLKQRTPRFRSCVTRYVQMRRKAGLADSLGSTPEARRQLEWYATRHGVSDRTTIVMLDLMQGICNLYFRLKSLNHYTSSAFAAFESAVKRDIGEEDVVIAFHDGYVAVGGESPQALANTAALIFRTAKRYGVRFQEGESVTTETTLQMLGFTFSGTSIGRPN